MSRRWTDPTPFGLPFEEAEYEDRLARVRAGMGEAGLDLLLLTTPENIYWLTGYRTTGYYVYQAFLLRADGEGLFVTTKFEGTNVQALSRFKEGVQVTMRDSPVAKTLEGAERMGAGEAARIGYDQRGFFLPVETIDALRGRFAHAAFVPASGLLEKARAVKSPAEIDCIRRAAAIASAGVRAGIDAVAAGRTENHVSGVVYRALMEAGGEHPAGGPYVVTGPRAALAHMLPERAAMEPGHLVYFEVGGCWKRYSGSIMRMASVGQPSDEGRRLAAVMIGALEAAIAAIAPGVPSQEVDRAGRSVVEKAGYGEFFHHRFGYSMGVAFAPGWGEGLVMDIAEGNERRLEAGMVFHCVPLVVIPEFGCMGFSETILVTPGGREVLTDVPRELAVR